VYSVPQFLAQVTARLPAHMPPRGHVYRVRGLLLSDIAPAQYALRVSPTSMGIAVQAVPPDSRQPCFTASPPLDRSSRTPRITLSWARRPPTAWPGLPARAIPRALRRPGAS